MKKIIYDINDKYNTIIIRFQFIDDIKKESLTRRSIIPFLLKDASNKYPSEELIEKELDNLYGAYLSSNISRLGNKSLISFKIEFIDPKILNDSNYTFKKCWDFLNEIIYNPYLINNSFSEKAVEREKNALLNEFRIEKENKENYALNKLLKIVYSGTYMEYNLKGFESDLVNINQNNLYQEYLNMINNNDCIISCIGNVTLTEQELIGFENDNLKVLYCFKEKGIKKYEEFYEVSSGEASYLNICFDTNTYRIDFDFYAMNVFNQIFGGDVYSLLFQKIRENKGLCYSINSAYYSRLGIIVLSTQIMYSDFSNVIDLIEEIIQNISNGLFDDSLLSLAKKSIKSSIIESKDNQSINLYKIIDNDIFDIDMDSNAYLENILKVSKEDIINCAKKLNKLALFCLRGDK